MLIPILKTLHVTGALLFLGAGLMTAWYKFRADRSGDVRIVVWCQQEIVRADWIFTTPSAVILPVTGIWLVYLYNLPWTTPWVLWGIGGFSMAGLLWLPAVRLQLHMRQLAEQALASGEPLPAEFHRMNRLWLALGVPAFAIAAFTVWLMVAKGSAFAFF